MCWSARWSWAAACTSTARPRRPSAPAPAPATGSTRPPTPTASATAEPVRVALLGPLEVRDDAGALIEIPGARLRALLTRLALEPGRTVGAETLIDAVWGDRPPAGAANALQTLVSRLRRVIPGRLESRPTGYRLSIGADDVDVGRFERLVAEQRPADALQLWRGAPPVHAA